MTLWSTLGLRRSISMRICTGRSKVSLLLFFILRIVIRFYLVEISSLLYLRLLEMLMLLINFISWCLLVHYSFRLTNTTFTTLLFIPLAIFPFSASLPLPIILSLHLYFSSLSHLFPFFYFLFFAFSFFFSFPFLTAPWTPKIKSVTDCSHFDAQGNSLTISLTQSLTDLLIYSAQSVLHLQPPYPSSTQPKHTLRNLNTLFLIFIFFPLFFIF